MKNTTGIVVMTIFFAGCAATARAQGGISMVAAAVDRSPSPPVRSTYRDVSLKVAGAFGESYFYKWFRGRTATQVHRDDMEETLTAIALPEAIRYARTMASCSSSMSSIVGNLGKITMKLGPEYEQKSLCPGGCGSGSTGSWEVTIQGRHYSDELYALKSVRACSLSSQGAVACAANPLMTTAASAGANNLADLLDIRIENGRCVAGATGFAVQQPLETFDPYRAAVGVVQSRTPMPPPTDLADLHATHEAHMQVSDFRCDTGPAPEPNSVEAAHLALEGTALTEDQHHFLRMKSFAGFEDTAANGNPNGWTHAEICQWARLQDRFHGRWIDDVAAGNWGQSRKDEDDHQLAHICMGLKDHRFSVRFSCGRSTYISNCPVMTCAEALVALQQPPYL